MAEREALVARVRESFRAGFGRWPTWVATAPGRINLIGEHTDYNAGLALPAAIDRWVAVGLAPRTDDQVRIRAHDLGETASWSQGSPPARLPSWAAFCAGALAVTTEGGAALPGLDAVVSGTVPTGSGLSSSAALSLAWLTALAELTGQNEGDLDRVRRAQRIEHDWLGVHTGLLDQLAIQLARPGQLARLDFAALRWDWHPARLDGWCWVAVHSGVTRELADSAYDDRVRECREGLSALRGPDAAASLTRSLVLDELPNTLGGRRLRHVVTENARVDAAVDAIATGDTQALGRILKASHASLRDDYQVSCGTLDQLVDLADGAPGCAGARMMGGGFGGCTLNLVQTQALEAFERHVGDGFTALRGRRPPVLAFRLVGGPAVAR